MARRSSVSVSGTPPELLATKGMLDQRWIELTSLMLAVLDLDDRQVRVEMRDSTTLMVRLQRPLQKRRTPLSLRTFRLVGVPRMWLTPALTISPERTKKELACANKPCTY